MESLSDEVERFFRADGPLARALPGYTPRSAQIEMALRVAENLMTPGSRLMVEAGTGTGKSLAYLVPSLLSEKKVVVTTGTKALQDQLFHKDLPLVLAALEEDVGLKRQAALMKGRSNYLCLIRYERFVKELNVPILANITEFGATPLFTREELASVGVAIQLYPLSAFRAANKAAENVYNAIRTEGHQQSVVDTMQTRAELYDRIGYHAFEQKLDALFAAGKK